MKVSPAGWGVGVVGLLGTVLGLWAGWSELIAIGLGALVVLLGGVALSFGRAVYEVDLDLPESRVPVGQRVVGRLLVTNRGSRRTLAARAELPVGGLSATVWLPGLGVGQSHEELFSVPTDRRSVVGVGPVAVRRGDPFGLVSKDRTWNQEIELLVHPRIVALTASRPGLLRDLEGQATRDLSDSDLSFHALRDYVAGDDRRFIHWRTSARTGTLMVRQFEDTRRTRSTVALATGLSDYADADEFELAVSVAASVGLHVLREERELTFIAGATRVDAPTSTGLLDECARLVSQPDGAGTADLPRRVARDRTGASVAFLVGGSTATQAQRRQSVSRAPAGLRVVQIACRRGAEADVRHDGLATLMTVGDLDDLVRAMRRVVA
jgi:uncharacterized protein (DUF58 family)